MSESKQGSRSFWAEVLPSALLVGSLDIGCAFLQTYLAGRDPLRVLLYISSAAFGPSAMTGGAPMMLMGLFFHFIIAGFFTVLFYWIYPRLNLTRFSPWLVGIVYGIFVWVATTRILLPFTRVRQPFQWDKALIAIGILILAIGLPLSFRIRNWCKRRTNLRLVSV